MASRILNVKLLCKNKIFSIESLSTLNVENYCSFFEANGYKNEALSYYFSIADPINSLSYAKDQLKIYLENSIDHDLGFTVHDPNCNNEIVALVTAEPFLKDNPGWEILCIKYPISSLEMNFYETVIDLSRDKCSNDETLTMTWVIINKKYRGYGLFNKLMRFSMVEHPSISKFNYLYTIGINKRVCNYLQKNFSSHANLLYSEIKNSEGAELLPNIIHIASSQKEFEAVDYFTYGILNKEHFNRL